MKIGVNSRLYQNDNTGIPYYIFSLYKTLLKTDKKNQYILFQTENIKTIGNTKTISVPKGYIGALLFDIFLVNKLIKTEKIDIFHGAAHILPFFKQKKVKYIVTIHDLSFLAYPKHYPLSFRYVYKFLVGRSLRNADAILAVSINTKRDIIKYYKCDEKKIHVLYSGVNEMYFSKKVATRIIKEKYFFSITTHPTRKNINSILSILSKHKELKLYKFVIVGIMQKDQKEKLKALIKELQLQKTVIVKGYMSEQELLNLYHHAEFFIYPSFYEGFGFPVLEAMAARCPVITSNNSSLNELILNISLLFNPYDEEDIYDKMMHVLTMPYSRRKELIEENYERTKTFTWEKTAKQFIQIYKNL